MSKAKRTVYAAAKSLAKRNKIKGIYGRENIAQWLRLRSADSRFIIGDKNKAAALLRDAGIETPGPVAYADDLIGAILSHSGGSVKGKTSAESTNSTQDKSGVPNNFRWNYFYTPVQAGDEVVGVRIAVRDMANPTESQIYNWKIKTRPWTVEDRELFPIRPVSHQARFLREIPSLTLYHRAIHPVKRKKPAASASYAGMEQFKELPEARKRLSEVEQNIRDLLDARERIRGPTENVKTLLDAADKVRGQGEYGA